MGTFVLFSFVLLRADSVRDAFGSLLPPMSVVEQWHSSSEIIMSRNDLCISL